jgi:hypothetical protein
MTSARVEVGRSSKNVTERDLGVTAERKEWSGG